MSETFRFEGFRLDRRGGGLFRETDDGNPVPVAAGSRALDLLGVLVERHGDLVSKDEIMDAVWPGIVVEDNNLTVQISALRRILDQERSDGSCIQTVAGRGYRFVVGVTRHGGAGRAAAVSDDGADRTADQGPPDTIAEEVAAEQVEEPPREQRFGRLWGVVAGLIVGALAAAATGAFWASDYRRFDRAASPPPRLSIVVLPFTNLSDDRAQQYFADGITEDLTTDLSRIPGSFVISRNTAFAYKDKPVNAKQVGRELGVRYVLEGSVQRLGTQVRVNAQLIDAETNAHLWAERLERDAGDLFALQTEITGRIAVALNLALIDAEAVRPTDNPDALDFILQARAAMAKRQTRDSYAEALSLYERALELDPHSVEAQSRLTLILTGQILAGMVGSTAADIARAEVLVGQALAASPHSRLAHNAKAQLLRVQGRCEDAIPEYEAVLASDRNSVNAMFALGQCKMRTGSIEETIALEEAAIRLSPRDPQLGIWYHEIGRVHLLQSHNDDAIVWLEKARGVNPALPYVHAELAAAYALKGETERATTELAEAHRLSPKGSYTSIARLSRGYLGVPKVRALYEATFFTGLRKAGVPE